MTDTLAHDWNIPSSKTIDEKVYRIHAQADAKTHMDILVTEKQRMQQRD